MPNLTLDTTLLLIQALEKMAAELRHAEDMVAKLEYTEDIGKNLEEIAKNALVQVLRNAVAELKYTDDIDMLRKDFRHFADALLREEIAKSASVSIGKFEVIDATNVDSSVNP